MFFGRFLAMPAQSGIFPERVGMCVRACMLTLWGVALLLRSSSSFYSPYPTLIECTIAKAWLASTWKAHKTQYNDAALSTAAHSDMLKKNKEDRAMSTPFIIWMQKAHGSLPNSRIQFPNLHRAADGLFGQTGSAARMLALGFLCPRMIAWSFMTARAVLVQI